MHISVLQPSPPSLGARLLRGLQETRKRETLEINKEGGPFENYSDLILSNIYGWFMAGSGGGGVRWLGFILGGSIGSRIKINQGCSF